MIKLANSLGGEVMKTKHFSNEEWADFVRHTLPVDRRNEMELHLGEGCRKCKTSLEMWDAVLLCATAERSYVPPDSAVRTIKGLFALHKPVKRLPRALEAARLVFDSFRQPLPAGVRAGSRPPRQVLYKSGGYWVDMRLEKAPTSDRLTLVGQILDARSPNKRLNDVPVFLLSGSRELARTATNRFGEFHLDVNAVRRPRVCLGITKGKAIIVLLPLVNKPMRRAPRAAR